MKNRFRKKGDSERNGRTKRRRTGHVLDVHVRASARKRPKRLSAGNLRLLRIGGVCAGLLVLGFVVRAAVKEYFLESPEFTLHVIAFKTDGKLTKNAVLQQAELETGVNLLSVDLDSVRGRLLELPEIKSVELRRKLPDKLSVAVVERRPMAWLACKSLRVEPRTSSFRDGSVRGLMIDSEGVIIECRQLLEEQIGMPVIHMRDLPESSPGHRLDGEQITRAVELIELTQDLLVSDALVLKDIIVRNNFSLEGIFNSGAQVVFGLEELESQIRKYQLIHADSAGQRRKIKTADLRLQRNVAVTYFEAFDGNNVEEIGIPVASPLPQPESERPRPKVRRSAPVIRRAIPTEALGDPELRNILGAG